MHSLADGRVWSVSRYLTIPHTADFSADWVDQVPGNKNGLRKIDFNESGKGIMVGSSGTMYLTDDFGANWSYSDTTAGNLLEAKWSGPNTVWHTTFGTINKSMDSGQSWELSFSIPGSFFFELEVINEQEIWTVSNKGFILHTLDGGDSWNIDTISGEPDLRDIIFLDDQKGYAVGQAGALYGTQDGGTSWDSLAFVSDTNLDKIFFKDSLNGWILPTGFNNQIFRTEDGGTTWSTQDLPINNSYSGMSFSPSGYDYLVAGAASGGLILISQDGGMNWEINQSNNLGYSDITTVENLNNNSVDTWVVGLGGNVEFTSYSEVISSSSTMPIASLQIYPNPGKNEVQLDWPYGAGTLEVYHLNGQLQKQMKIQNGTNDLSMHELQPGLYIMKAVKGSQVYTTKWIKN